MISTFLSSTVFEAMLLFVFSSAILAVSLFTVMFSIAIRCRFQTLAKNVCWVLRYTAFVPASYILRPWQLPFLMFRIATSSCRTYPNCHIIGEMKCGTTALLGYLTQHPNVNAPFVKETHFFAGRSVFRADFEDCDHLYRSFFSLMVPKWLTASSCRNRQQIIQVDATPQRLYLSWTAEKIKRLNPNAKIIVCLRDPVERALSNYRMLHSRGKDKLKTFEEAISAEDLRAPLTPSLAAIPSAKKLVQNREIIFPELDFAYRSRGAYIHGLRVWAEMFGKENILLIDQNKLLHSPQDVMNQVFAHLHIDPMKCNAVTANCSSGKKPAINLDFRINLRKSFAYSNLKLQEEFNFAEAANWNSSLLSEEKYSSSLLAL